MALGKRSAAGMRARLSMEHKLARGEGRAQPTITRPSC
jgi:hypothetical protein